MSAWSVKGKFAIVTGAAGGINFAFAEQLLNAGCSVVLADLAPKPESEALIAKFPHSAQDGAPSAIFSKLDQSDWTQISATWDFAIKTFGQVDLLCPGAGVWEPPHSAFWEAPGISSLSKDDANSTQGVYNLFAVNTTGPIRFAQIAIDYWLQNKIAGNLIVVSSMAAYLPSVGTPLYNASKAALVAFIQSLAQLRTRLNIRTAALCPGPTETPATQQEYCKEKVRAQDIHLSPTEVGQVMLQVVQDAEYGDGNIVEALQFGSKNQSDVRVRNVPYQGLLPALDFAGEFSGKNIMVEDEKLWHKLTVSGMR